MDRRIGRFSLNKHVIDRFPEEARAVMGRCIIVRCEMIYESNTLEYVAISPDFNQVRKGEIVPRYDVIIGAESSVRFERSNA